MVEFVNPSQNYISDINSDRGIQSYCDEINQIIHILDRVFREAYRQHNNLRVFFIIDFKSYIKWNYAHFQMNENIMNLTSHATNQEKH